MAVLFDSTEILSEIMAYTVVVSHLHPVLGSCVFLVLAKIHMGHVISKQKCIREGISSLL